ncbi:hypothetical protein NLI96_g13327 [Meripilus lineatus]|uniref:Uncharacterized protein n=1 Tax=Meripilus lineatus TaxID=2056292 RepID=A0AAD5UN78_9APHY|nr:hypothetical protein NLI96_g13327 [Physisporinus lineatus]
MVQAIRVRLVHAAVIPGGRIELLHPLVTTAHEILRVGVADFLCPKLVAERQIHGSGMFGVFNGDALGQLRMPGLMTAERLLETTVELDADRIVVQVSFRRNGIYLPPLCFRIEDIHVAIAQSAQRVLCLLERNADDAVAKLAAHERHRASRAVSLRVGHGPVADGQNRQSLLLAHVA